MRPGRQARPRWSQPEARPARTAIGGGPLDTCGYWLYSVTPLTRRGDVRVVLGLLTGQMLEVDLPRIESDNLVDHLQGQLGQAPNGLRARG